MRAATRVNAEQASKREDAEADPIATSGKAATDREASEMSRVEPWDGLPKFRLAASASEVAVVYYAGHGIEVDKRNFLMPVDARLVSDGDVEPPHVSVDAAFPPPTADNTLRPLRRDGDTAQILRRASARITP